MKRRIIIPDSPDKTRDQLRRAIQMLESYKARETTIVRGLGEVVDALTEKDYRRAQLAVDALMQTDLRQASEEAASWMSALVLAVGTLQRHDQTKDIEETLRQVRELVPDLFTKDAVGSRA